MVNHHLVDLGGIGLTLIWIFHPSCPAAQPILPNSDLPKQKWNSKNRGQPNRGLRGDYSPWPVCINLRYFDGGTIIPWNCALFPRYRRFVLVKLAPTDLVGNLTDTLEEPIKLNQGGRHQPNKSSPCWSLRCSGVAKKLDSNCKKLECTISESWSVRFLMQHASCKLVFLISDAAHVLQVKSETPTFPCSTCAASAAPLLHIKIRDSNLQQLAASRSIRPS